MGTWGVGLYAGDTASDVRDEWLTKLRQGAPTEQATAELVKEWGGADDEPLFWLALADTQWTWGRLETHVRERAQQVLAAGGDLAHWEGNEKRSARARVFKKLAARLETRAPPPKAIHARGDAVAWKRGQLWSYSTLDGKTVVLRVTAVDPKYGLVPSPLVELLDVVFERAPPSDDVLDKAGLRPARTGFVAGRTFDLLAPEHRVSPMFMPKVMERGMRPRRRLRKLRATSQPRRANPATTNVIGVRWDVLDQFLSNAFDVGGPRLGAVHAWRLTGGGTAFTVVEFGSFTDRDIEPSWQLGVLDCRGPDVDARAIEAAGVLCSIIVTGFSPTGELREVGYRPPPSLVINPVSGAVHKWARVPRLLEAPDSLVAADKSMKALLAKT